MTDNQRIVKNIAKLLAGIIIILIVIGVVSFVFKIAYLVSYFTGTEGDSKVSTIYSNDENTVKSMSIDIDSSYLTIKTGDSLSVESNSKKVTVKERNGILYVSDPSSNWIVKSNNIKVIIYNPNDMIFDEIELDTGAAVVDIDRLTAERLDIDLGAGKVTIGSLTSTKQTAIDGGAGNFEIQGGSLNDLEIDWGVGNAEITAEILGRSEIDSGVGNLDLDLIGTADDYKIRANKGLGNFTVDGKSISDGDVIGSGSNVIDIDCGVGNINVSFVK